MCSITHYTVVRDRKEAREIGRKKRKQQKLKERKRQVKEKKYI